MRAIRTTREEVPNISAEQRVKQAIRQIIPPMAHYKLKPGDTLYAFREVRKMDI